MPDLQPSEAAKRAFGIRLRDLRLEAGMKSARQLAARTGFSESKVSRIENGRISPSEEDVRDWARACNAEKQIPELIAARREVAQVWTEYRRELRVGQKEIQTRALPIYLASRHVRIYESLHIPGILQTFDYARTQRRIWARLHGLTEDDIDQAARNRLMSQQLVTEGGGPTFSFLLEATVLYNVLGDAEVMGEQYDLLLEVATKPHVAVGVVPLATTRTLFPGEGFYLFDERLLGQEFWSGKLRTSQATEVAYFVKVFNTLRRHAVYGAAARQEIETARQFVQSRARS